MSTGATHQEFFNLVSTGDDIGLRQFLEQHAEYDISTEDADGRSGLQIAVSKQHEKVVDILMDIMKSPSDVVKSLFYAILNDDSEMALLLINHARFDEVAGQPNKPCRFLSAASAVRVASVAQTAARKGVDEVISPDATPLLLAAQRDMLRVVQRLLEKGHFIEPPHSTACTCGRCSCMDQLRKATARLDTYRGLCRGSYILLTSVDPIITAVKLRRTIRILMRHESYFKAQYLDILTEMNSFVIVFLDNIRDEHELMTILDKKRSGLDSFGKFSRLKLMVLNNWKDFVHHPNVQTKLLQEFYKGGDFWNEQSFVGKIRFSMFLLLLYPVLAVVFLVAPNSRVGQFVSRPWMRMLTSMIFYMAFLVLLFVSANWGSQNDGLLSDYPALKANIEWCQQEPLCITSLPVLTVSHQWSMRRMQPSPDETTILIFVLAMLLHECFELYEKGLTQSVRSLYKWMNFASIALYLSFFALYIASAYRLWEAVGTLEDPATWEGIAYGPLVPQVAGLKAFYWILADRWFYEYYDPSNVMDGLFACANLASFIRFSYYFALDQNLGPMRVSLGKMVSNIAVFGTIFFVILVSFLVSFTNLYWYYSSSSMAPVELTPHDVSQVQAVQYYGDLWPTIQQMLYSLFGAATAGSESLVNFGQAYSHYISLNVNFSNDSDGTLSWSVVGDDQLDKIGNVVQDFGMFLWFAYQLTMVVVLMNMLIAMMSQSYDETSSSSDSEWKFVRTELMLQFIEEKSLAVPFNILPNIPRLFSTISMYVQARWLRKDKGPKLVRFQVKVPIKNVFGTVLDTHATQVCMCEECAARCQSKMRTNKLSVLELRSCEHQDKLPLRDYRDYQDVLHKILKRVIFQLSRELISPTSAILKLKEDVSSFESGVSRQLQTLRQNQIDTNLRLQLIDDKLNMLLERIVAV